jgi:hypothetical protein
LQLMLILRDSAGGKTAEIMIGSHRGYPRAQSGATVLMVTDALTPVNLRRLASAHLRADRD